jgi:hypothetical protein
MRGTTLVVLVLWRMQLGASHNLPISQRGEQFDYGELSGRIDKMKELVNIVAVWSDGCWRKLNHGGMTRRGIGDSLAKAEAIQGSSDPRGLGDAEAGELQPGADFVGDLGRLGKCLGSLAREVK